MDRNNGKPSFMHIQNLRMARAAPSTISADRLTLDNVSAYNVDVDTGDSRTSSIITLREVPSFLIEAFSRIWCLDGCKVEGIFRKEGAAARTKEGSLPVFFGAEPIPKNFLVHDICSWIKRFFRDLKQPLFRDREHILLDFANTFPTIERRDELFTTLMTILDRIPASHMGALGYLMRCLQEISEEASVHHMTVENLATVFAPAIFRDHVLEQKPMKKSRSGSQDNMLSEVKRINELKVLVIQVMIENAEKIIVPKDCYKATRRPSDLKKKERGFIASSVQKNGGAKISRYEDIPPDPVKKHSTMRNSQSASDLILHVEQMVELQEAAEGRGRDKKKTKQQRSNSVVRAFGALKSHFKKSMSNIPDDGFMDTPDPPVLVSKRIPHPESTPVRSRTGLISMDPSASSDEATLNVPKTEKIGNDMDIHMIKKVMSPKDKKKRAPIPSFDNPSSNDEKKENIDFTKSVLESVDQALSNTKKPMGYSNSSNIQRTATQMQRRPQPLQFDRDRRHTAPVNQALRRNQPNTIASGLNTPRKAKVTRRSSSRRSGSCTSTSSEDSFGKSILPIDSNELLEQKGIEARRRRRYRKKNSNSSMTNLLLENTLGSPEKTIPPDPSPHSVSHPISKILKLKDSETSDNPVTSDTPSSPEIKRHIHSRALLAGIPKSQSRPSPTLSVDVHVVTSRSTTAQITPSPDSGCSSVSSKQLQSDSSGVFVKPKDPVFVKPARQRDVIVHERPAKVNIRSTGTSIMLHTESSRAKCRSPIKRTTNASGASSRQNSKSPARTKPRGPTNGNSTLFSRHDPVHEREEDFGRPSIAQIQGTGFVNQRIQLFSKDQLKRSPMSSKSPTLIPKFAMEYGTSMVDSYKPAVKPAAHGIVWNKQPNIGSVKVEALPKLPKFAASKLKAQNHTPKTPKIRVRVGERKQDAARRAALFQAMSKLSVRSPLKNLQGATPKKLLEQTRTPSPNLSAARRFASIRTRNASPLTELIHREKPRKASSRAVSATVLPLSSDGRNSRPIISSSRLPDCGTVVFSSRSRNFDLERSPLM